MKNRNRNILLEGIVVTVVLGVLLVTMIPHARNAHIHIHVTQTLSHLKAVSDGMAIYRIDHGDPGLLRYRQSHYGNYPFETTLNTYSKHGKQQSSPHQGIRTLDSSRYDEYIPSMTWPTDDEQGETMLRVCEVTAHSWRLRFKDYYERSSPPYPEWFYFKPPHSGYFGFAPGATLDTHTVVFNPLHRPEESQARFNQFYVSYDPTNGLVSHGFVTYNQEN